MKIDLRVLPRAAAFVAGFAAGALVASKAESGPRDTSATSRLQQSIRELEARIAAHEASSASRMDQIEVRLEEQSAKVAGVATTAQIVSAMEQLLKRTVGILDERLSEQSHSIEILGTTVAETDHLLERVLESIDSLQGGMADSEPNVMIRPAV
jgi:uncharacterized coiled-coil protein SlyX